ncbi:MAG: lysylphosphatidylglycerol synthase transmembrane domain-containing protein [Terracidiphilus sp.]
MSLVLLVALVALGVYGQHKHPFHWHAFIEQFRLADWRRIGVAVGCIYLAYVFRSARWALLLKPNKKVPPLLLLGTQVIGFTAVALIGRIADLVRPYLVARKTGLPLSTQIAVYIVERLFDAGSMGLFFSSAMLLAPAGTLPHPELFRKFGYWGLAGTVLGALFLVAVRLAGGVVASFMEGAFGIVSRRLGHAVGGKIRGFRTGLNTLRTPADFAVTLLLSMAMWGLITMAYVEGTQAFFSGPQRASVTLGKCMVLMVGGGVASIVQLPVLGWFTQIAALEEILRNFFSLPPETATACAATLLLVTFLSIVPVGLVWAQLEHVSLRKVAVESEYAGEELTEDNLSKSTELGG